MTALALEAGQRVIGLSFDYGQRHKFELEAAERVADTFGVARHITVKIDLRQFGGSALTSEIDVPQHDSADQIGGGIPITYVPARNTIVLSFALAGADVLEAGDIFIGVNALDYSGYPDCRPEYIAAYQKMAALGTRLGTEGNGAIQIHTPLIQLTKAQIIRRGTELGARAAKLASIDGCMFQVQAFLPRTPT